MYSSYVCLNICLNIYIYIYFFLQNRMMHFIVTLFLCSRCLSYDTATSRAHYITSESPPLSFSADSKGKYNNTPFLNFFIKLLHDATCNYYCILLQFMNVMSNPLSIIQTYLMTQNLLLGSTEPYWHLHHTWYIFRFESF